MSRMKRVVVPGYCHHVTQRGNGGRVIFLDDDDRRAYLGILRKQADRYDLAVIGYCLMSNHVHLVVIPSTAESMSKGVGRAAQLYSLYFHKRYEDSGHLWNQRYYSVVLDGEHFWHAMNYVERNPVKSGLNSFAWEFEWSSARAHVTFRDDSGLLDMAYWKKVAFDKDWQSALMRDSDPEIAAVIQACVKKGIPLGSSEFRKEVENRTGITLARRKVGRPATKQEN